MKMKGLSWQKLPLRDMNDVIYASAIKIYGEEIRGVVEECDEAFLEGVTRRDDYEAILRKMIDFAEVIVVKYNDKIAGYASMYANDFDSKTAYISMFGVKKEFQGKGLGTFLMGDCCKVARERGMEHVLLEVLKENIKGIKFYKRFGFSEMGNCSERSIYMGYDLVYGGNQ